MDRPGKRNLWSLVSLNALFYFAWAWGCYQTVYLQENGMTSTDIGLLNAVSSVVAIFASTFWGMISDRINSIKKTMLINFGILMLFTAGLPLLPAEATYATGMFIIYCGMLTFTRTPSFTLMDNITVRNCLASGLSYGAVRSVGSITYTIGSVIISFLLPYIGVGNTFFISALLMLPTLFCVLRTNDPKVVTAKAKTGPDKDSLKQLFKGYYYVTFLLFTMLFFIPRTAEYSFLSYFMEEQGISLDTMGLVMAVRAVTEVPFLFFISFIRRKVKLKYLIMLSTVSFAVECLGMGFVVRDFGTLLFFSAFFGIGSGLFIGGISDYLFCLAPDELKATAQSIYASVSAASSILGNLLGGYAYALLGGKAYYVVLGAMMLASAGLLLMTTVIGRRRGIPNPADAQ